MAALVVEEELVDEVLSLERLSEEPLVDDPLDVVVVLSGFLLDLPAYRSEYQPPPLRMKFPEVIWRRTRG